MPFTVTGGSNSGNNNGNGPVFGGQLGYNYQAGTWVFGVEGDVDGTNIRRSQAGAIAPGLVGLNPAIFPSGGSAFINTRQEWLASIRGRLGTTWGPGLFEPASGLFWRAVGEVEPSLVRAFNPWDNVTTPHALEDLFRRAGVVDPDVAAVPGRHQLEHPDMFWDIVLGSGYRATVDALSPERSEALRRRLLSALRSGQVTSLRTDVVYGTARRPRTGLRGGGEDGEGMQAA